MIETETRESSLIHYLVGLELREDRAALAALRRGLGRPPGMAPELYPHVGRFLSDGTSWHDRHRDDAKFIVAALFGMLPNHRSGAGSPLRALRYLDLEGDSTERRVMSLLNADANSLPTHLRHLIALIRSHQPERHLDYVQLLRDITNWNAADRWVQQQWARDWWAWSVPLDSDDEPPDDESEPESEEAT